MEARTNKEPFAGAYYAAAFITIALLLLLIVITSAMPPGVAGFIFASVLGLVVNPKYAPWFFATGVLSSIMGFIGHEPTVAWGGIGLALSQIAVYYWHHK